MTSIQAKLKTSELKTLALKSAKAWESWLKVNHSDSVGVWLCIKRKDSTEKFPTYDEALDVALCYGWIDGQKKSNDQNSWHQRFTPRRPRSNWSKRNTEHVERLIQAKRMKPAGLVEVEAAKKDGRWSAAYDSARTATIPEDFIKELRRNKKAASFFKTLNKTNMYSIAYRLQTAKTPETREKRMKTIIAMMIKGEKFH